MPSKFSNSGLLIFVSLLAVSMIVGGLIGARMAQLLSGPQQNTFAEAQPLEKLSDAPSRVLPLEIELVGRESYGARAIFFWEIINHNDFAVPYEVRLVYRDKNGRFLGEWILLECRSRKAAEHPFLVPPGELVIISEYANTLQLVAEAEASVRIPFRCGYWAQGWAWDSDVAVVSESFVLGTRPNLTVTFRASDTARSRAVVSVAWYGADGNLIGISVKNSTVSAGETGLIGFEGFRGAVSYKITFLGLSGR